MELEAQIKDKERPEEEVMEELEKFYERSSGHNIIEKKKTTRNEALGDTGGFSGNLQ